MVFKNYINKISDFIIRRLAELVGIFLVVISILLFISLISYSPDDPNFIFPENQEIKNLLGFRGSFIADIFFQSIGLISLLIPFSLLFTGISINIGLPDPGSPEILVNPSKALVSISNILILLSENFLVTYMMLF